MLCRPERGNDRRKLLRVVVYRDRGVVLVKARDKAAQSAMELEKSVTDLPCQWRDNDMVWTVCTTTSFLFLPPPRKA